MTAAPSFRQELRFARSADGTRIAFAISGAGYPLVSATHCSRGCGLSDRDISAIALDDLVSDMEAVVVAPAIERSTISASCWRSGPRHQ